jgi:hypothetical protein
MEPIEKYEHKGYTVEIWQDEEPMSPAEWDTLGTLVAFSDLERNYSFAEETAGSDATEALERSDGDTALLIRYLRLAEGKFAVPFYFADYGSGGARIWKTDENPSGYIYTTEKRITELCGNDPRYHRPEWIESALEQELDTWSNYVEGNVFGFVVKSPTDEIMDSCWGFYADSGSDPYGSAKAEANASAEYRAKQDKEAQRYLAL